MVIVSHVPGRLRLREPLLRLAVHRESLCRDLAAFDPAITIDSNPRIGSLLLRYDPARLAPARLSAWLTSRDAEMPPPPRPARSGTSRNGWVKTLAGRDANRVAKYGLFATTAAMLLALGTSTRVHAAAGGLNLAFLLVHLAHHRNKLLK